MKRLCIGIMAHVDSGKTTLSEALLYTSGALRKLGRVDHRDAFLDTDALERARGITIFSKQALIELPDAVFTLLDTPGHVDFSAETERALQVMDYAILVVSGADGVQSHTETLWRLLERYGVPCFIFVNKLDLPGAGRAALMDELRERLSPGCVDMLAPDSAEELALGSEELLEAVAAGREPQDAAVARAVRARGVFPCYFGSALRLEGVEELLGALSRFTLPIEERGAFGARIFKVTREGGERLTWLKVTGGELKVKDALASRPDARIAWSGKADQLRLYSGAKYSLINSAAPGTVCAVTGLGMSYAGEGLGAEPDAAEPALAPVLRYRVLLPEGCDKTAALRQLREIEQEDPMLHVVWDERLGEIQLRLMGEVQLEILRGVLSRRFGLEAGFDEGGILYKETVSARAEGMGHYEPLRHYAEAHIMIEPAERGSGVTIASDCPTDELASNWQRLILTHLAEKEHLGALTGSPITDVKLTLVSGRAHPKHTEGGDFRQATYRAVRQGLRTAAARGEAVLLEPWYDFTLRVPQESVGRALADLARLSADFAPPETHGADSVLTGRAPVASMMGYAREVAAYTHGRGQLVCIPCGYDLCHNAAEAVSAIGYDADADTANSADSVFCSHGAGVLVRWDEAPAHMHLASAAERAERLAAAESETPSLPRGSAGAYRASLAADKELMAIFERTYGPVKRGAAAAMRPVKKPQSAAANPRRAPSKPLGGPEYLLIDGYNVIFAWDELRSLAEDSLEAARRRLMDILCNYAGYTGCVPILVFDAWRVKGGEREIERYHNLYVVYTKEAETADTYIEKATHEIAKRHNTRVVTSDAAEQLIILGNGALRVSSRTFLEEVRLVEREIRDILASQ